MRKVCFCEMPAYLPSFRCCVVQAQSGDPENLFSVIPHLPETIVDRMLQLGGSKAGEKVFDLGSGDGRIVVMAAQKFHA